MALQAGNTVSVKLLPATAASVSRLGTPTHSEVILLGWGETNSQFSPTSAEYLDACTSCGVITFGSSIAADGAATVTSSSFLDPSCTGEMTSSVSLAGEAENGFDLSPKRPTGAGILRLVKRLLEPPWALLDEAMLCLFLSTPGLGTDASLVDGTGVSAAGKRSSSSGKGATGSSTVDLRYLVGKGIPGGCAADAI